MNFTLKNKKKLYLFSILAISLIVGFLLMQFSPQITPNPATDNENLQDIGTLDRGPHPLSIQSLKDGGFQGSEITIEEKLSDGSNYERFLASYKSEGLKIYALLTIPKGEKPKEGWPAIIFNHGYIAPSEYRTTERYIAYTDAFSRNGYILFRPDYRGHGSSEGAPAGGYGSNAYTIDVLNAVASIKRYNDQISSQNKIVDVNRIGMWGHSMGGHITLRSMVVNKDIKAGVIWAGVVASYPDLLSKWRRGSGNPSVFPTASNRGGWRQGLIQQYGSPEVNPEFWNSISATSYLSDISGPLQLHHGTADTSVPVEFSEQLDELMKRQSKEVELYIYEGDDHNLAGNLSTALQRSVDFFDSHVKGEK